MFGARVKGNQAVSFYPNFHVEGMEKAQDGSLENVALALLAARDDDPHFTIRYCENLETECDADLTVFFCETDGEDAMKRQEALESEGWQHVSLLERFFHARSDIRFMKSPEERFAVFVCAGNLQAYHMMLSVLPRILRGFDAKSLSEKELELLETCLTKDGGRFIDLLDGLYGEGRIHRIIIMRQLDFVRKKARERRAQEVKGQIHRYREEIDRLQVSMDNYARKVRDAEMLHFGILNEPDKNDGIKEMMDLVNGNENIVIPQDSFSSTGFSVAIRGPLVNFPDIRAAINNSGSTIYGYIGRCDFDEEDRRRLMRALFVDETYTAMLYGSFSFDVAESTIYADRSASNAPSGWNLTAMPNPHLYYFTCTGSYGPVMRQKMTEGDYVGAITACANSVSSVNLHEQPSFTKFVENLFVLCANAKVLRRLDGTALTPVEAVKELKQQEENG